MPSSHKPKRSEGHERDEQGLVRGLTSDERELLHLALDIETVSQIAAARHTSDKVVTAQLRQAVQKLSHALIAPAKPTSRPRVLHRGGSWSAIVDREPGEQALRAAIARATRTGAPLSVVHLLWAGNGDVDTRSVSTRGAELSWRRVSYLLAERLRPEDLCIRWTDGSAVVVLEHTTEAQAGLVARRLRSVDEAAAFGIGVAERRAGEGVQHLVGRAGDAASKELVDIQTRQRLASSMHFS